MLTRRRASAPPPSAAAPPSPSGSATSAPGPTSSRSLSDECHPNNFERVEAGVADDRCHAAAAIQVQQRPEEAEDTRRDRRVPSLHHVAEAERHAQDYHADVGAAEMLFEPVQQKRALQLLAHT